MKYRILTDWRTEGMKWQDGKDYDTVNEAVKVAVESGHGMPFYIVSIINWEALPLTPVT